MKHSLQLGALAATAPRAFAAGATPAGARYLTAAEVQAPLLRMEAFQRRAPFGWQVGGLPPAGQAGALELRWDPAALPGRPAKFRICVLDTREPQNLVEVAQGGSGRVLGQFDLRWVGQFQVFEIPLAAADADALLREGARLRQVQGTQPVWLLTGSAGDPALPDALRPHLLPDAPTDPLAEFYKRMDSLACIQPFGWMEGCVLDGLRDLARLPAHAGLRATLQRHLALFFKPDGRLTCEDARGQPHDDRIGGIESTLPFAALAAEQPRHRALELALKFWAHAADAEGCIQDGGSTTTEGAYTVAYPLAVIARQRQDRAQAERALLQLRLRQARLFDGHTLHRIRQVKSDGSVKLGDRNWCRGIAWQLLGAARTLQTLDGCADIAAARDDFVRLAEWVQPYQLPGGLWSVFVDAPQLAPDTSGSAGLAAALALGAQRGWLPAPARAAAQRTLAALQLHLTPDGFLGGAAQSNKGGEALQRSAYRVIYQMGMGLMAQLIAALETA